MSDYIELDKPKTDDRVIRELYTPKEVVGIIHRCFNQYNGIGKLTRGEFLLLWEFSNWLVREFKDDKI